jgi:hypothetical protein
MTPQAFSYGTLGPNGQIYIPPYGLTEALDFMLRLDPITYEIKKISLEVDTSFEKWTVGTVYKNFIYFLPYNESRILVVDTDTDQVRYLDIDAKGSGKFNCSHLYNDKIVSLPYGVDKEFDYAITIDLLTDTVQLKKLDLPINDQKKWHTTQMIENIIHGVPRGERWNSTYFPYRIEYNCDTKEYKLFDLSYIWKDTDKESMSNKKYTTLAKYKNKLYAPPYSENPNFDIMLKFNEVWSYEHTGLVKTSRKYYSNTVASNGKIYFPPAGHDEDWAEMLIIDAEQDTWYTKKLSIGKESKKYFAGIENSKGKIYYIPRGGCVCEPTEQWKKFGDLVEVLVIDIKDDSYYTIDIGEFFTDNTTIEKYNCCILVYDKIFAFPYGESTSFQTLLVFDTLTEKVIETIDLNDI